MSIPCKSPSRSSTTRRARNSPPSTSGASASPASSPTAAPARPSPVQPALAESAADHRRRGRMGGEGDQHVAPLSYWQLRACRIAGRGARHYPAGAEGDLLNLLRCAHFSLDNVTKISYKKCTINKCAWYSGPRPPARLSFRSVAIGMSAFGARPEKMCSIGGLPFMTQAV